MLESIVHKALDYVCFLPTCDESNTLGIKVLNVALPMLVAIAAVGISRYKFSQTEKLDKLAEQDRTPKAENVAIPEGQNWRAGNARAMADQRATFQVEMQAANARSAARLQILQLNISPEQKRALLI